MLFRSWTPVAFLVLAWATIAGSEYREIEIQAPGTIEGRVFVTGEVPELPPQPVFKQKEYCGEVVPDERLVVTKDGALANVVVYLADIKAGKAIDLSKPVRLDNRKCRFDPHVVSATLGQTLEIHNSDPFLHDAHGVLGGRTLFNVAVLKGKTVYVPLLEPGVVHVNCNVRHTWMHAYLFVAEHPYHTVTDHEGRFRLENVPPGIWRLRAWHEMLGSTDLHVTLMPGEKRSVNVYFTGVAEGAETEKTGP